jgi:hypothetical protein
MGQKMAQEATTAARCHNDRMADHRKALAVLDVAPHRRREEDGGGCSDQGVDGEGGECAGKDFGEEEDGVELDPAEVPRREEVGDVELSHNSRGRSHSVVAKR